MLTRFRDFDANVSLFDELRRQLDRVWDDFDATSTTRPWEAAALSAASWPRVNLYDDGAKYVVQAEVPGMTEKELTVTLQDGQLLLSGTRKADAPEGYTVHRRERSGLQFSRSFTLPSKVDAEKTTATVKDGVLTITLAKAQEAQPRQIAIRSSL